MRLTAVLTVVLALGLTACTEGSAGRDRDNRGAEGSSQTRACDTYTTIGLMRVDEVVAHDAPSDDAAVLARFPRINAQGAEQVFPILGDRFRDDALWHEVMLPIRPNGTTGWIRANTLRYGRSDYRIEVDLQRFRLRLFDRCDEVASYRIGVGTSDTPTPRGDFFLNSLLKPPTPGTVYGALAFGLSAYSDVIRDWEGGGIVGLHGTNDPSSLGSQVSHGCIRMDNAAIRFLARRVPLGTLVEIS